jgi:hypothetical protein
MDPVSGLGGVEACAVTGCATPTQLANGPNVPWSIAVDEASVYWTDSIAGTVMKCAQSGCNGNPTVLATVAEHTGDIAVDATSVYFTTDTKVMKLTPK